MTNKTAGAAQRQLGGNNPDWLNHLEEAIGDCVALWAQGERAEARAENPRVPAAERMQARRERDEHQEALRLRLFDLIHDATGAREVLSIETLRESRQWPKTERTAGGLRAAARMSVMAAAIAGQREAAPGLEPQSAA